MLNNSEFCVYGGIDDEVYGVEENLHYNVSEEYDYYSSQQPPSFSDNYVPDSQEDIYDFETDYQQYNQVYYLQPAYMIYYPVITVQYNIYYSCYPYYESVPVYYHYYVPISEYNFGVSASDEQVHFDENPPVYSVEENSFTCEGFDYNLYSTQNRSFNDMSNSFEQTLSEGITTSHLSYEEYPEKMNGAPADDEDERVDSEKKVENQLGDEFNNVDISLYGEDIDVNVIKKISSLSIDDVKEDIDENYENGKSFLYNQVLKGYTEIKSQLEDLEWECHSLDDIPEEDEEGESESSDMELNENVLKDCEKIINVEEIYLTVEEEKSSSLSEESETALNDVALAEESRSSSEESKAASYEEELVEECQSLNEESQTASYEEAILEECLSLIEESQTAANEEALVEENQTMTEESQPSIDSSAVEESQKVDFVPDVNLSNSEEDPDHKVSSQDLMEERAAAPKSKQRKKRFSRLRKFFGRVCCCITKPP